MNKADKALSLLGIARRAGRVTRGFDAVIAEVREGQARLILLAADVSERTERGVRRAGDEGEIPIVKTEYEMADFSAALGVAAPVGVVALNDRGFANKMTELLSSAK